MLDRRTHFHFLPVIAEFFSAFQAYDVRGRIRRLIRVWLADGDWKHAALVMTAEQCIDESRHLIPLRRVSADSPAFSDEDELTPVATVSVMHQRRHGGETVRLTPTRVQADCA